MKIIVIQAPPADPEVPFHSPFSLVDITDDCDRVALFNELVGGFFSTARVQFSGLDCTMWVNDEGMYRPECARNPLATQLVYGKQDAHTRDFKVPEGAITLYEGDLFIAGNVVITGNAGPDGETTGVSKQTAQDIFNLCLEIHRER